MANYTFFVSIVLVYIWYHTYVMYAVNELPYVFVSGFASCYFLIEAFKLMSGKDAGDSGE